MGRILLLAITAAVLATGCQRAQTAPAGNAQSAASAPPSEASATPMTTTTTSSPKAEVTPPAGTDARTSKERVNSTVKPDPSPIIGSGGNDFALFTRTRGVLESDAQLKGTEIVITVKDGVITLTGQVSNDGQLQRALKLVKGVEGVKGAHSQLTIGAKRNPTASAN